MGDARKELSDSTVYWLEQYVREPRDVEWLATTALNLLQRWQARTLKLEGALMPISKLRHNAYETQEVPMRLIAAAYDALRGGGE